MTADQRPCHQPATTGADARWMNVVLWLAAVYNVAWGGLVVLFPLAPFAWAGMTAPRYPEIWQCVGMMVGVYGVGYAIAAFNPVRHWAIILVGLLGKLLGPLGFVYAASQGKLPWIVGWTILTNDLIWWGPFVVILWRIRQAFLESNRLTKFCLENVVTKRSLK